MHYTAYSWVAPLSPGQREYLDEFEKTPPPEMPFPPFGQMGLATSSGEACNDSQQGPHEALTNDHAERRSRRPRPRSGARPDPAREAAKKDDPRTHRSRTPRYDMPIARQAGSHMGNGVLFSGPSDADPRARRRVRFPLLHEKKATASISPRRWRSCAKTLAVGPGWQRGFTWTHPPATGCILSGEAMHTHGPRFTRRDGLDHLRCDPRRRPVTNDKILWDRVERFFNDLQYQWYDKVVGFDSAPRPDA